MSSSDVLVQVRLARIQIVVAVLVSVGSTLFAVGVGFGVTIPPTLQQLVGEGTESGISFDTLLALSDYASNYALVLAVIGLVLIVVGVVGGMGSLNAIKKNVLASKQ